MRKLNDAQVEEVKKMLAEKRYTQAAIAKKFKVSETTIYKISANLYVVKNPKKKFKPEPRTSPPNPSVRKLTFADAQEIRKRNTNGTPKKQLSREFGVSEATIKAIIDGRRYTK